jgi:hypothetical protein
VTTNLDELTAYVGAVPARALAEWAEVNGRELLVPAQSWVRRGYTDALLAPLFVNDPDIGGQLVVVKVLPAVETAEPRAHRRAIREAPERFKPRLVRQIFEPYGTSSGGVLTFQGLAGGSAQWRPLADVPAEHTAAACAFLSHSLIAEWNPKFGVRKMGVVDFLRAEIGSTGSVRRHLEDPETLPSTLWLRSDQDPPLPSPLPLIGAESLFGDALVDVVVGRTHSDLHDLNVLLRQRGDDHWIDTFVLVDLMTYDPNGQLGRDLVRLLLSVTGRRLPDLSEQQRTLLLSAFVRPDETLDLPAFAVDPLHAIYQTAATELSRAGREVWRQQFLLSLVAQGMVMTTFENFDPAVRWWFFRLSGYAARQLVLDFHSSIDVPLEAAPASSPFEPAAAFPQPMDPVDAVDPVVPRVVDTPAPRTYSASKKRKVCDALGADWVALAARFAIPQRERSRLASGRKPYAVWEWIEREERLHELPQALRDLGLGELADVLDGDEQ